MSSNICTSVNVPWESAINASLNGNTFFNCLQNLSCMFLIFCVHYFQIFGSISVDKHSLHEGRAEESIKHIEKLKMQAYLNLILLLDILRIAFVLFNAIFFNTQLSKLGISERLLYAFRLLIILVEMKI